MTDPEERRPFVPLPMAGAPSPTAPPSGSPLIVVYVRYRDPDPLEFAGVKGILAGPVFHAAGVLQREDDEFIALGEIARPGENPEYVARFGKDMFPAYRNVLTIPKVAIVERRDMPV